LFAGTFAFAQVQKGVTEFNIGGSLTAIGNGDTYTTFSMGAGMGHFIADKHEVGAVFNVTKIEGVDAMGELNGFYALNFPREDSKILPYVGGLFGFGFESGENPLIFGVFGGLKYFITEGGAIHFQPFYRRYNYDDYHDLNYYGIEFGISLFIGGD
jgi:hypothetical protein